MKVRFQAGQIFFHAVVWSIVSCLVAVQMLIWRLPETDGAYGINVFVFLIHPFVLMFLLMFAGPLFLMGWFSANKHLCNVRLGWAIPRIAATMIVTAIITGYLLHYLSIVFVLMTGLMAIHWCKNQAIMFPRLRCDYDPESDWRNLPAREADQPI
tara:strand:- start:27970 stop:28434 length:465 start_codon:yes stop_codon:yes gene_type:complete